MARGAMDRKSGLPPTLRWRETDSNPRSLLRIGFIEREPKSLLIASPAADNWKRLPLMVKMPNGFSSARAEHICFKLP